MGKQPGVMLYFEVRPSLDRLDYTQKGRMFEAILDYGEFGVVPELEVPLTYIWDFMQPRLDRDRERYEARVRRCQEAAKRRWDLPKDASAYVSMPTTTAITAANTNTNTNSLSSSTPAAASSPSDDFEQRRSKALAAWEKIYGAEKTSV